MNQEKSNNDSAAKASIFLIFSAVILAIVLAIFIFSYFSQKKKMVEMEIVLTQEKDSLANELRKMMYGYDTLKTDNDTLNAQLAKEREKIKRLLEINASNAQLIKKYRS